MISKSKECQILEDYVISFLFTFANIAEEVEFGE